MLMTDFYCFAAECQMEYRRPCFVALQSVEVAEPGLLPFDPAVCWLNADVDAAASAAAAVAVAADNTAAGRADVIVASAVVSSAGD